MNKSRDEILIGWLHDISTASLHALEELKRAAPESEATRETERWLPVQAAAERLGFSVTYLYRNSHKLPFMRRHGRTWRVSSRALDAFAAQADAQGPQVA